ncbi:MAG: hypothetical protein AAGC70_02605 [Pseudomonadota bacterium]
MRGSFVTVGARSASNGIDAAILQPITDLELIGLGQDFVTGLVCYRSIVCKRTIGVVL